MQVVTLGPAGTYAHRAAAAVADAVVFRPSVTAVVEAVETGAVDRGVVPIENSIEGSVTESLDALERFETAVTGELVVQIRHALIAQAPDFETVASHPQALAQCRRTLEDRHPDAAREATASTASAVELAREDAAVAAIAHPSAAGGDLTVLERDIQDRPSNETRFLLIAPASARSATGAKTSLIVYPNADHPGLLLAMLEPFAERSINLSRIESRPSGKRLGDYLFHLDCEGALADEAVAAAVSALEDAVGDGWVEVLGSYDAQRVDGGDPS